MTDVTTGQLICEHNTYNIRELAEALGLKVFDTALPQDWVDRVYEHTAQIMGTTKGIWPHGFVWSYDNSPMFGEPYPVTEGAKMYARFLLINPRDGSLDAKV